MRQTPLLTYFVALEIALCGIDSAFAQGIVDCVSPAHVTVVRFQGQVFDPGGTGVPDVKISLVHELGELGATMQLTADEQGRFQLDVLPDRYNFKAIDPLFQTASGQLTILGREDGGRKRPDFLYVVIGMAGSFCPWMTTSKSKFERVIRANKRRMKEAAQQNATQK